MFPVICFMIHTPVLLEEVLRWLDPQPGQKFIDATADGGGHTLAIAERVGMDGKVLAIEWDSKLFQNLESRIKNLGLESRIIVVNDSYVNISRLAADKNFLEADGVLFDLGLSSWHLEESGRGFTFRQEEPLDMRFNPDSPWSAKEIVNVWPAEKLEKLISEYGEERFARSIARSIAQARRQSEVTTTKQLAEIISGAVPGWYRRGRRHPATKTFQALRMEVNQEAANIEEGLAGALAVLKSGGKLAVISFHGVEHRIVKRNFRQWEKEKRGEVLTKAVKPSREEVKNNPRSRSAQLRVFRTH